MATICAVYPVGLSITIDTHLSLIDTKLWENTTDYVTPYIVIT